MNWIKIPSPNFKHGNNPKYLIIHYTAGGFQGSIDTFMDPTKKVSSHYLISKRGEIVQMVEETDVAFHAGISAWGNDTNLNNKSIGIELENWGPLKKMNDGTFKNIYGSKFTGPVYTHLGTSTTYWDYYPFIQMNILSALTKDIFTRKKLIILGHQDIAPSRKLDPGKAFDMLRFKLEMGVI